MEEIQIFNSPQFGEIRTTGTSENPLFCATDVCKALGYANGRDAIAKHTEVEDVAKRDTPTSSGIQAMSYVTESGLYSLIFGSKLPTAKAFKRWVTSEILPSIRKHGAYATETTIESIIANPENGIRLLQALQKEREERQQLEARSAQQQSVIELQASELKEAAPKVHYVDSVLQSVNTYTVQQIAKELDTTANRLYAFLRDRRVMFRQSGTWMLTSRYNGKGYTKTRTHQFTRNDGTVGTSSYTVFTEKGRALIHGLAEGVRV